MQFWPLLHYNSREGIKDQTFQKQPCSLLPSPRSLVSRARPRLPPKCRPPHAPASSQNGHRQLCGSRRHFHGEKLDGHPRGTSSLPTLQVRPPSPVPRSQRQRPALSRLRQPIGSMSISGRTCFSLVGRGYQPPCAVARSLPAAVASIVRTPDLKPFPPWHLPCCPRLQA